MYNLVIRCTQGQASLGFVSLGLPLGCIASLQRADPDFHQDDMLVLFVIIPENSLFFRLLLNI
jgi:hypothetical protein